MTLEAFPAEFRPGAATSPQPTWLWRFLSAEQDETARLMGFFEEARLEIEQFIRGGDLTLSDATFYRQLLDETNRISSRLSQDGAEWTSKVIPEAYSAGWRTMSPIVVPRAALEVLSRETLGLIVGASEGIRTSIRQTVAQGILQGLSGSDLRQRILQSGLSNIPHWPNVEYRAGVIARTETMRAYNGGLVASIESTGARFVRWIISPDEAVCPRCGPRAGLVYRVGSGDYPGDDPYPNAAPLPKIPAHPRCRCSIRAEYRGPDGKVLRPDAPPVAPKLPADAMGGKKAPIVPPAAGDFAQSLSKLSKYGSANAETWQRTRRFLNTLPKGLSDERLDELLPGSLRSIPAGSRLARDMATFRALEARLDAQFWRSLGTLSAEEMRLLAALKGTAGNESWSSFLSLRYGISFGKPTGWTSELRFAALQALERLRAVNPAYVVDSDYLHSLGLAPYGAKRFGSNVIARAFASGEVQGNMTLWQRVASGSGLRGGPGVSPAEEVILHEFIHTIGNRFGYFDRLGYKAVEFGGDIFERTTARNAWWDEYAAIRKRTVGIVSPTTATADPAATLRVKIADLQAQIERDRAAGMSNEAWWRSRIAEYEANIAKLEDGINAGRDLWPTDYARGDMAEDFAEAGMLFMLNPARMRKWMPERYAFFRDKVFGGFEP